MPKVMIALNTTWNLVNFRANLIQSLMASGCDVVAIAPADDYVKRLQSLGCEYVHIEMDNKGTRIFEDLKLCYRFFKVLKNHRPDILMTYTIKPNIYFSLVAHFFKIPVFNTVTGLGSAYIHGSRVTKLIDFLYRLAFFRSKRVFFQNSDDMDLFLAKKLVTLQQAIRVPGSGVDLKQFQPKSKKRASSTVFQFLFVGRVIADKGIHEFYEAVVLLKEKGFVFKACILGFLEVENPGAISGAMMDQWIKKGHVEYFGSTNDVRPFLIQADCIVLPSYREGTSKALLEACAMAKPIITTDTVGCRDLVEDGLNGYLCQVKDVADLAYKMETILKTNWQVLDEMGMHGRQKIEKEYDEQIVIQQYISILQTTLSK